MLHPLPKNVFSSRLVSTLAITTHPPRCCVDHARLVADKLANGKEPKEAPKNPTTTYILPQALLGYVDIYLCRYHNSTQPITSDLNGWYMHGTTPITPAVGRQERGNPNMCTNGGRMRSVRRVY